MEEANENKLKNVIDERELHKQELLKSARRIVKGE